MLMSEGSLYHQEQGFKATLWMTSSSPAPSLIPTPPACLGLGATGPVVPKEETLICLGPSPIQELLGKMAVCRELPSGVARPWMRAYVGHACPIYLDNIPVR